MNDKVKLPREVAEAINEFNRCEENNRDILIAILGNANSKAATTIREFAKLDVHFEILLEALVNGYEIEVTPEDKVREYYNNLKHSCNWSATGAIEETLAMLNIKIPGINT